MSVPIVEAVRAPRAFARHVRARIHDAHELHARASVARLRPRWLVAALALFAAVSAIAGGFGLIASRPGDPLVPSSLLAHTPFESFLVPGLLLGVVVGGTSAAAAILVWRRSRFAIDALVLAGGALAVWILAEVALLRELHGLHVVYGALGIAILGLGVRAGWRSGLPRHRWVIAVTGAEAAGFLAPALAGILMARGGEVRALPLIAAGLVEGLALGAGQAWAFPLRVRRLRYALLTAAGAGAVWACVAAAMWLGGALPPALAVIAGAAAAVIGLAAIGAAQWLELRHHAPRAWRWIAWTALAWAIALPLAFTPGPLVDESTPLASHVALWGSGGLLMAYVMSIITYCGVRRLRR
jgi:hypothetical protein